MSLYTSMKFKLVSISVGKRLVILVLPRLGVMDRGQVDEELPNVQDTHQG
jgi:hypothetical protein